MLELIMLNSPMTVAIIVKAGPQIATITPTIIIIVPRLAPKNVFMTSDSLRRSHSSADSETLCVKCTIKPESSQPLSTARHPAVR